MVESPKKLGVLLLLPLPPLGNVTNYSLEDLTLPGLTTMSPSEEGKWDERRKRVMCR